MPFDTRLRDLIDAIFGDTGRASDLNTAASDMVGAINEVKNTADAAAGGGIAINDAAVNLVDGWSSSKISAELALTQTSAVAAASADAQAQIVTALEGEDLSELAAAVAANAAADANLATAASVATLSATVNLKANISDTYTRAEIGDPDYDYAAYWNSL